MSQRSTINAKRLKGTKRDKFVDWIKVFGDKEIKKVVNKKRKKPLKKKPIIAVIPKTKFTEHIQRSSFVTLEEKNGETFKVRFTSTKSDQRIVKKKGLVNPIFVGCPLSVALQGKKIGDYCKVAGGSYKIIDIKKALQVKS